MRTGGRVAFAVLLAVGLVGCSNGSRSPSGGAPTVDVLSRDFAEVIPQGSAAVARFNAAGKQISDAYNDDSVGIEEFGAIAKRALPVLDAADLDLARSVALLRDQGLAAIYRDISANFHAQAVSYRRLISAVATQDDSGQRQETTRLVGLGRENARLVAQSVQYVRAAGHGG